MKRNSTYLSEIEFRENLAGRLAALETGQIALSQKIDLHHTNLDTKLTPLLALHSTVQDHDRQIHRWKGVNAALAMLITLAAAIFGKLKLWR
jgi:hypothetical protein